MNAEKHYLEAERLVALAEDATYNDKRAQVYATMAVAHAKLAEIADRFDREPRS